MSLTPTQMIILGACLLVGYLTWSAVQGEPSLLDDEIPRVGGLLKKKEVALPVAAGRGRDPFRKMSEIGKYELAPELTVDEGGSGSMRLTGVVGTGPNKIAYVNGKRLREGDSYRGFLVQRIEFNRVSLSSGDDNLDLWLDSVAGAARAEDTATMSRVRDEKDRIEIVHTRPALTGDAPANGESDDQQEMGGGTPQ